MTIELTVADRNGIPLHVGDCFRDDKYAWFDGTDEYRQVVDLFRESRGLSAQTVVMPERTRRAHHGNLSERWKRAVRITCETCPHLLTCSLLGQAK